eukprot:8647675-Lingulodinium_polyedra.AAC.1
MSRTLRNYGSSLRRATCTARICRGRWPSSGGEASSSFRGTTSRATARGSAGTRRASSAPFTRRRTYLGAPQVWRGPPLPA